MRVAYVCSDPGVPVFGRKGASIHVQAVLRVLASRGTDLHLVATRIGGDAPPGLEHVCVHELPSVDKGDAGQRERAAQDSDAAIATVLDGLAAAGALDLVYERYSLWGRTATAWGRATGTRVVLEVNAPLVEEQVAHRQLVDRARAEVTATAALSAADVVVCVSDEVARWARRSSRRPDRVHVVPNGVDADRVQPAARPPIPATEVPFTIGFVGTLKPWHGVHLLLEALALLEQPEPGCYRLLLVGDGPETASLRRRAEELGVGQLVEQTGSLAPADVPAQLHRMDVATAPYPWLVDFYFSPLKIYEYLAAGLPVVASRIGQVPQVLDQGALGVLVEPGDVTALARAVADLRKDATRRAQLRGAGRAAVLRRHSWDGVVDQVLALVVGYDVRPAVPA